MRKTFKVPIYNQHVTIDNTYGDCEDEEAVTTNIPLKIHYCPKYWCLRTLAHECIHAVNFICLRCNLVSTYEDDEMYAYLYGWMLKKVYDLTKEDLHENFKDTVVDVDNKAVDSTS